MKELKSNLWEVSVTKSVGVTTNGCINKYGNAIMGKGIALQAVQKFPSINKLLGQDLKYQGNHVFKYDKFDSPEFDKYQAVLTIPTKENWRDKSNINLILQSCTELIIIADYYKYNEIYIPRLGCGNGNLEWDFVKSNINYILDDRFIICNQ